jgi:hypothetical protein
MAAGDWLELGDAIAQLRSQLSDARAKAPGEDILFTVGKAEIELAVELRREGGGGLGFKFGIVSLEGKGSVSSGSVNRLRLELIPHDPDGHDIDVRQEVSKIPEQ